MKDIEDDPWLHSFSTDKSDYVYDTRTNLIFPYDDPGMLRDRLDAFYRQRYGVGLDEVEINEVEYPLSRDQIVRKLDQDLSELVINVTEGCNFRCDYCIYGGNYEGKRTHSDRKMDLEIAKQAIDYYSQHTNDPIIYYYGGEPLTEYQLIKELTSYARDKMDEINFGFTTNGYLLTPEKFEWLADQKFGLTVSLDGPKYIHDRNRRTRGGGLTWNRIMNNLRRLKQSHPDYYHQRVLFNTVVTDLLELGEIDKFFKEEPLVKGHQKNVSLVNPQGFELKEPETPEEIENYRSIIRKLVDEFGESLREGGNILHGLWGSSLKYISMRKRTLTQGKVRPPGICIPGHRKLFVDVDGDLHPCEQTDYGFEIGDVEEGLQLEKVFGLMDEFVDMSQSLCPTCWNVRICPSCYSAVQEKGYLSLKRMAKSCNGSKNATHFCLNLYTQLKEGGINLNEVYGVKPNGRT